MTYEHWVLLWRVCITLGCAFMITDNILQQKGLWKFKKAVDRVLDASQKACEISQSSLESTKKTSEFILEELKAIKQRVKESGK